MVEAVSSVNRSLTLAVPPGRMLVQRRLEQDFAVAEIEVPLVGNVQLANVEFQELPYEEVARRGGAINLHPDSLSISYGARVDQMPSKWVFRHGFFVNYDHQFGEWLVGSQLGLGFSNYDQFLYANDEMLVNIKGYLGWWTSLGTSRLEISAGPQIQVMFQERTRLDTQQLIEAGLPVPPPINNVGWGLGGGMEIRWYLSLGSRLALFVTVHASVLAMQIQQQGVKKYQALPQIGSAAGVGYRF